MVAGYRVVLNFIKEKELNRQICEMFRISNLGKSDKTMRFVWCLFVF